MIVFLQGQSPRPPREPSFDHLLALSTPEVPLEALADTSAAREDAAAGGDHTGSGSSPRQCPFQAGSVVVESLGHIDLEVSHLTGAR